MADEERDDAKRQILERLRQELAGPDTERNDYYLKEPDVDGYVKDAFIKAIGKP